MEWDMASISEVVAESNELKSHLEMCLGTFKETLKYKGVT